MSGLIAHRGVMLSTTTLRKSIRHWWNLDDDHVDGILLDQTGVADLTINSNSEIMTGNTLRRLGSKSTHFSGEAAALSSHRPEWIRSSSDYTVVAWIQLDAVNSSESRLIISDAPASDSNSSVNFLLLVGVDTACHIFAFWEYDRGVNVSLTLATPIDTNAHCIAVSRNSSDKLVTFWVDGVNAGSVSYSQDSTGGESADKRIVIGNNQSLTQPLQGFAQDVVILDRPISDYEASWFYNAGAGRSYADLT